MSDFGLKVYNESSQVRFDVVDRATTVIYKQRFPAGAVTEKRAPVKTNHPFPFVVDWSKCYLLVSSEPQLKGPLYVPPNGADYNGTSVFQNVYAYAPTVRQNGNSFDVYEPYDPATGLTFVGPFTSINVMLVQYK